MLGTRKPALFLVVALWVAVMLFTASCGDVEERELSDEPRYGGVLEIAYPSNPPTLDMQYGTGTAVREVSAQASEYLFDFDENLVPRLGLAEEHTVSDDGLVHTVKLREGVLFHNGDEMTAEDVVASIHRRIAVAASPPEISLHLESVTAADKYTVEFRFPYPLPHLRHLVSTQSHFVIYPKELCEKYPDGPIPNDEVVGTGPYKFKEFIHDRHVHLVRFEDYSPREEEPSGFAGRKHAYVDEILIHIIPDQSVRAIGVETGDYHYAVGMDYGDYPRYADHPDIYVQRIYPRGMVVATINCTLPPTDNVKIRQAILAAVDCEEMARVMYEHEELYGIGLNNALLEGKEFRVYSGSEYYNQADPEKAKQLLEEAGYDGTPIVIIGMTEWHFLRNGTLALAYQLEKAGFNVETLLGDQGTFIARYLDPKAYHIGVLSNTGVPTIPEQLTWTRDQHIGWWMGETPRKQELGELLRTTFDYEEKLKIWDELHGLYYEEAAGIKFVDAVVAGLCRIETGGWMSVIGHRYWNAYIKK